MSIEATSPATKTGDAPVSKGSGNIETGQAAVLLMASANKAAKQPARQAAEEIAPEVVAPDLTLTPPTAEAQPASESTAPAEETETAAETTEAAPEETEEEADSVPSQTISFTPEQQKLLNKRIGKEVAKTKAMEAQKAELAAKVAELEAKVAAPAQQAPVVVSPAPNTPLSDINDIVALGKVQETAKEAARYIEDTLDDPARWQTMTDPNNEDRQVKVHKIGEALFTETDLKRKLREARRTLEDQIPQRAQFLAAKQQITQNAHARFPFLTDKQSPDYQLAELGRRNPQYASLMAMPNAEYLLGVLVKGHRAIEAEDAAKAAPAKKPAVAIKPKPAADQTAVSASGAAARAPIGSAERQQIAAESAKLSAKGGITSDDAVGLLLKQSQLRKTR